GKRITEKDIAGGQARDKKLKGVYCSTCAEGVMTMENMALTDESAKLLLQQQPAPPPAPAPQGIEVIHSPASTADLPSANRRSSANRIQPAKRSVVRTRDAQPGVSAPR